jgi:vitamin-K-epoxide reductase (warfarin-sensitive)
MRIALLVLAAAGIVVSSLALARHFAPEVEPADPSSYWNSSAVNHSPCAVVDGIPVAVLGIAGYALTGAMAFYRRRELTAVCSLFGLAYELYLTNLEAHILQLWCVYCPGHHHVHRLLAFGERPAHRQPARQPSGECLPAVFCFSNH